MQVPEIWEFFLCILVSDQSQHEMDVDSAYSPWSTIGHIAFCYMYSKEFLFFHEVT